MLYESVNDFSGYTVTRPPGMKNKDFLKKLTGLGIDDCRISHRTTHYIIRLDIDEIGNLLEMGATVEIEGHNISKYHSEIGKLLMPVTS